MVAKVISKVRKWRMRCSESFGASSPPELASEVVARMDSRVSMPLHSDLTSWGVNLGRESRGRGKRAGE